MVGADVPEAVGQLWISVGRTAGRTRLWGAPEPGGDGGSHQSRPVTDNRGSPFEDPHSGTLTAPVSCDLRRRGPAGTAEYQPAERHGSAGARQPGRTSAPPGDGSGEGRLYEPVLARVIGDGDAAAARGERFDGRRRGRRRGRRVRRSRRYARPERLGGQDGHHGGAWRPVWRYARRRRTVGGGRKGRFATTARAMRRAKRASPLAAKRSASSSSGHVLTTSAAAGPCPGSMRMSSGPSSRYEKPRLGLVELRRAHPEVEQDAAELVRGQPRSSPPGHRRWSKRA